MISIVRKEFCTALRDIIEHGLKGKDSYQVGHPFIQIKFLSLGCFSQKSAKAEAFAKMTAWDLIIQYYQIKVSV